MKMKKTISYLIILALLSSCAFGVMSIENFRNVQLGDPNHDFGKIDDFDGHVTLNVKQGWNIIPLRFLSSASGRYWSFKKDTTCDQELFKNIYVYSPVVKQYSLVPVIDDWNYPKSRNNNFLLGEFQAKYYHAFAGAAWVYSPKACVIEADHGAKLLAMNGGSDPEGISYNYKDLKLKAGWNFVPVDYTMSALERTPKDIFDGCGVEKFNLWDAQNQQWVHTTSQHPESTDFAWDEPIAPGFIFSTFVIKTTKDCNLAKNVFDGPSGSTPPTIPN